MNSGFCEWIIVLDRYLRFVVYIPFHYGIAFFQPAVCV